MSPRRGRRCQWVEVDGVQVRVQTDGRKPTEGDLEVLAEFRRQLQAKAEPEADRG